MTVRRLKLLLLLILLSFSVLIYCGSIAEKTYSITGSAYFCGAGIEGVKIILRNERFGEIYAATDVNGVYVFNEVWEGKYTIIAEKEGYTFSPGQRDLTVSDNVTVNDFTVLVTWSRTYGGPLYDDAYSVRPTSDCGFIIAGYSNSFSGGALNMYFIKIDAYGTIVWEKTLPETVEAEAYSIEQTVDDDFIAVGRKFATAQEYNMCIVKLKANGDLDWEKQYGGFEWDEARSIKKVGSDGYIVAGFTESNGQGIHGTAYSIVNWGLRDGWILRLENNGDLRWQRTYGGAGFDESRSIDTVQDGGSTIAGYTEYDDGSGRADLWVVRLDKDGNDVWPKQYTGDAGFHDEAYSVRTIDGGYVTAGFTSTDTGLSDCWVLRLNDTGSVEPGGWERKYGSSDSDKAYDVDSTADGGYIIAGYAYSYDTFNNDFLLMRLDSAGNVLWQRMYDNGGDDEARSVRQTPDGGFIVAGHSKGYSGSDDVWVIKVDEQGMLHQGE